MIDTSLSHSEYKHLIEQAPIMIWRSKPDTQCDYFNQRWLDFTGRTMEEELGDGWVKGVHPDDVDRCLNIYLSAFREREIFEMEYRLRRHDGVYRWIFDRGVPFADENGHFAGYIGSAIDLSESSLLRGMLPICSSCKSVREDGGDWKRIETYISEHSAAVFSHGLCPTCAKKLYPDFYKTDMDS
jgi:PAS domain S-box-containing protein